jgi:pectate lyase
MTGLRHHAVPATVLVVYGIALVLLAAGASAQEASKIPAFPGAEGFGAFAVGGRGGDVIFVTTLEDYGRGEAPISGSLRAAVEREGPRTIVFRVSGHIELKRVLEIRHPHLTIAGQTAPGDGISIKNYGLDVAAPDVVIRYLRIRPGDVASDEVDAINIRSSNVIIDHCSASWATDETVSVIGDATNVTVQWSLIVESLNASVHSKGEHGYGSLISTSGSVSVHHNIYALHKSRSPRPRDALLDFRNNVVYGWSDRAGYNADDLTRMNYVGNYLLPLAFSHNDGYAFIVGGSDTRMFVEGNVLERTDARVRTDWELIKPPQNVADTAAAQTLGVSQPFAAPSVTTHEAAAALEKTLAEAGATRPRRDAVDRRIIRLMRDRAGAIIDSQDDVGGWPILESGSTYEDADRDGMDDGWEERNGLDPSNSADHAGDLDRDGYTNLEEFLNETDPNHAFGWIDPPQIRPSSGMVFTTPPLYVTLSTSEPNAPIYYTTDGREPTTASARYEGPISAYDDAHVRAKSLRAQRPTTAAYAAYDRIEWLAAVATARHHPDAAIPGLRYEVYEADDWDEGVTLDELDPVTAGVNADVDFSLRGTAGYNAVVFQGWLDVPADGVYEFYLRDDVRSRLYVGGRLVTQGRPRGTEPGRIALRRGFHTFQLRSVHEEPRSAALQWSGPGIDRRPISGSYFVHSTANRAGAE